MPCDGPSRDYAYQKGEQAYEEVLKLLESKYHLSKDVFWRKDEYTRAKDALKLAIQEVIWTDDCFNW